MPEPPLSGRPEFRPLPPPPPLWRRAASWAHSHRDHLPAPRAAAAALASVAVIVAILVLTVRATGAAGAKPEISLPRASGASGSPSSTATTTRAVAEVAVVYVVGAVNKPGVYRVPTSARLGDAVDAAGGASDDADLDHVNLAAPVGDGDRIYVPHQGDDAGEVASGDTADGQSASVNINSANEHDLEALPGVGPSLAGAIVEFRSQHGRFPSLDSLLDVPGVGPAKLAALRAHVRL